MCRHAAGREGTVVLDRPTTVPPADLVLPPNDLVLDQEEMDMLQTFHRSFVRV